MAHIAKFQASALGRMCEHYDRTPEIERGYVRNNIDTSRTSQNYNLAPNREGGQVQFIRERIESLNLKRVPRKDAVRMCDCVVTKPQSLSPEKTEQFFRSAFAFLQRRYGAENTVSAYVHMDETTPHMHYAWVPVTTDGRLSAKDIVNRRDLRTLHRDLQVHLEQELSCHVEVLLGDEKQQDKALSNVPQKQLNAAREGVKDLEEQRDSLSAEIALESDRLERLRRRAGELEKAIAAEKDRIRVENYAHEAIQGGAGTRALENEVREYQEATRRLERARDAIKERIGQLRERISEVCTRISEVVGGDLSGLSRDYLSEMRHKIELSGLRDRTRELERKRHRLKTREEGLER